MASDQEIVSAFREVQAALRAGAAAEAVVDAALHASEAAHKARDEANERIRGAWNRLRTLASPARGE